MTSAMRSALPDTDLLAMIRTGDESALAELHARYSGVVFAFVLGRMSDRAAAEEVAADVWLGCWRSAGAFRGDSLVLTWLLGIAKRQVGSHTRRKRHPQVSLDDTHFEIADDDADPAGLVVAADQRDQLMASLRSLPPDLAEVVMLAWVHEVPYGQIATVVGIPTGTVKSRVSRARALLREELRRNDA